MTPFQAVYGVAPPTHLPYLSGDSYNDMVNRLCLSGELTLPLLKGHLLKAQHRMVQQANKHRSEREFGVGDYVFLKFRPFHKNMINNSSLHKLAASYFGPFEVIKRVSKVAYEPKLPAGSRIHPIFHIYLLKHSTRPGMTASLTLPLVDGDGQFLLTPAAILS